MNEVKEKLEEVILRELDKIGEYEEESAEKAQAVDNVTKLLKAETELHKIETDNSNVTARLYDEQERAEKEARDRRIDRYIQAGTVALTTLSSLVFNSVWMKRGFRFEETGSYTSRTFQNLFKTFNR